MYNIINLNMLLVLAKIACMCIPLLIIISLIVFKAIYHMKVPQYKCTRLLNTGNELNVPLKPLPIEVAQGLCQAS